MEPPTPIIGVFTASSADIDSLYFDQASLLGEELGRRNVTIVYGGTMQGTMGTLASSAHRHGARLIGVVPRTLHEDRLTCPFLDQLIITPDFASRIVKMEQLADVFIALPGGVGTICEILTVANSRCLSVHDKALVLINTSAHYDHLASLLNQLFRARFVPGSMADLIHIAGCVRDAVHFACNVPAPVATPLHYDESR